ncbi:lysophospholipase NTE1 [Eremomyces bilateralis CBS 781.70]|uniref:Lysophospholipase NTE1 n=1 Tax=Eremomyces bilateralis CBS 781.70 TaxID=1392243 RepID=A0A6G1GAY7_9PEZI|nr:lysophospholipase NTE1 [Eremomyces bilateralis CBS 781.70]KAF1815152.1 lysophospholipase NTE1 [Eremomyces bilateralis CBS 781.70]
MESSLLTSASSVDIADAYSTAIDTVSEATSSINPAMAVVPHNTTSLGLFGGAVLALLTFLTISLPATLYTVFSTSLTFTLNFTTLLLILLCFASIVSWVVRYRYMNMYERLPPEPQRDEPQIELFPATSEGDSKPGLSNYLDEFLSAIKVFGYLERPVFHELTRTMHTRKLMAGETLLLEEEQGFCLVVEGLVQIFLKSKNDDTGSELSDDESEDDLQGQKQGYQLLTEVKSGAPMSSLFTILSLFTEEIKLKHEGMDPANGSSQRPISREAVVHSQSTPDSIPSTPVYPQSPTAIKGFSRARRSSSMLGEGRMPSIPPLSLEKSSEDVGQAQAEAYRQAKSVHPNILARATVDSTIAIIPASAFRRLTRIYPKSTAQVISVIISRLNRVTLATGYAYLGLAKEILRTEKSLSRLTTCELPDYLRDGALNRLKEKFSEERERIAPEDATKGIALHNPRTGMRRKASNAGKRDASIRSRLHQGRSGSVMLDRMSPIGRELSPMDRHGVSAGDLLASGRTPRPSFSTPIHTPNVPRREASKDADYFARGNIAPVGQESTDEDTVFREAILDCFCKTIGLTNISTSKVAPSHEQSPRLVSFDAKKQKAVFHSAFGLMDPYETSAFDFDTESMRSTSISALSVEGPGNIFEELVNDVEILFFPKNAVLVEQGERNPGLYYVIDGFLEVSIVTDGDVIVDIPERTPARTARESRESLLNASKKPSRQRPDRTNSEKQNAPRGREHLYLIKPGGVAGYIGSVSNYRSLVEVTAKSDVFVGFLSRSAVERIVEKHPIVLLTLAKRLTALLPQLILHVDFALEWMQANAGQVIYNQGEESDAIYIVLNGRLRALHESDSGAVSVLGEYAQGDSVGELEVLTDNDRPASLHAIRDAELAKFPKTLFNSLAFEHTGVSMKISKIIARRMRSLIEEMGTDRRAAVARTNSSSTENLRTIAILPVTSGIPVVEFASRLTTALIQIGTPSGVASLNQTTILQHLGRHAFNRMGKLKLSQYLADLEEKFGIVLYVADTSVQSPWTQTCVSKADCILLVGLADGSPNIGEYERFLLTTKTTAIKELVLLHPERYCPPGLTRKWLQNRSWINGAHHHVHMSHQLPSEPVSSQNRRFGSALKQRVQVIQDQIQKYAARKPPRRPLYTSEAPSKSDFHRLARHLRGKSIGLVLGGGGARGCAHVGILRALEESGIPIDIIGGTSIGSLVGGLYAWDADIIPTLGKAKKFSGRMASFWRFLLDATYPTASYTTGHEFNRGIFKTFGNAQIEDFWIPFYCNSTNISKSRPEIHASGYAWRYVRASMSLAGLLPPLCDEGNLLLDGGYVDNLTVAHMKSLGADVIFAVDVGSIDDDTPQNFGDSLSGLWALLNRWNPLSSTPNPPTLSEIQSRLAYVSSVDALERAKNMPGCHYMRPDVDRFGTLEFGSFEAIYMAGYEYGRRFVEELREQGEIPGLTGTEEKGHLRRTAGRRASI